MSNSQQPLKITVVSPDITLNREVAWVLSAVGYTVQSATDREKDALWRRYLESDVLLIDGRGITNPHDAFLIYDPNNPIYQIVLYDTKLSIDFSELLSAGANDALHLPLSRGELIARLRSAARWLEFERRLRRHSSKSPVPGALSKQGFLRKLSELARSYESDSTQHTLVVIAIDWYSGIRRKAGEIATRRLVESAARILKRAADDGGGIIAYLEDGCFALLQLACTSEVCRHLAEQIANDFANGEGQLDAINRPTLTTALIPWLADTSPVDLLDAGLEVLGVARHSGGDCIVEECEYADELANWRQEMSAGNPFANVEAQDIMEPFAAVLAHDTDQSTLVEALCRSRVPVCPFTNEQGKLIGVANPADCSSAAAGKVSDRLAELPMSQPETIAHDSTFPDVYEAFSTRNCSTLLVVEDDRPLGYITCDGFLSLIEPVNRSTFAIRKGQIEDTIDLLVPSMPICEAEDGVEIQHVAETIAADD